MSNIPRRAFVPASPPFVADGQDPTFAAIERHRAAMAAFSDAVDISAVSLPGPEFDAANAITARRSDEMGNAGVDLVTVQPTTFAGLIALLSHIVGCLRPEKGEDWRLPGMLLFEMEQRPIAGPRPKAVRLKQEPDELMRARELHAAKIRQIAEALIAAGYVSLDEQAGVLGLSRSTTWTIIQAKHKNSGLSGAVIKCMLAQPRLPPAARAKILEYVRDKSAGVYGHNPRQVRRFIEALSSLRPETPLPKLVRAYAA